MSRVDLAFRGQREAQDGSVPGLASEAAVREQTLSGHKGSVKSGLELHLKLKAEAPSHWMVSLHTFAQTPQQRSAVFPVEMMTFVKPKLEIPEATSSC